VGAQQTTEVLWTDIAGVAILAAQLVVLTVAAIVAWHQVREARRLREAQTRPFVVVDFEVESFLAFLTVSNIGSTLARNVRIKIDPPLESLIENPLAEMKMLREGIATLAPGKRMRTLYDNLAHRKLGQLPDVYAVEVAYTDETGRPFAEQLDLDLAVYWNLTTVERRDIHDIHQRLKDMLAEMKRWTSGTRRGLLTLSPADVRAENERTRQYLEERRAEREEQSEDQD